MGGFILKKDIYIIKNDINDKVYVGQSKKAAHRWEQYKSAVRHGDSKQIIVRAMIKYGIEHFHMEILEHSVENFDEREIYWIAFYNSIIPNGYNIAKGGRGTGVGLDNPNHILTAKQLQSIIDDILYTDWSFAKIAREHGVNPGLVVTINSGVSYYNPNLTYPLKNKRIPKSIINQIIYALQYELDKSINAISREWGVDSSVVCDINTGELHHVENKHYPLRSGRVFSQNKRYEKEIKEALLHSDKQQRDIAREFNVSESFVSTINKGTIYHDDALTYPLRDNYQGTGGGKGRKLLPSEVRNIEEALRTTTRGMRKIAKDFNVSMQTVSAINIGSIKMYRQEDTNYPIRKFNNFSK